jgi:hypothetical protein
MSSNYRYSGADRQTPKLTTNEHRKMDQMAFLRSL